jgi:hypothetical protein
MKNFVDLARKLDMLMMLLTHTLIGSFKRSRARLRLQDSIGRSMPLSIKGSGPSGSNQRKELENSSVRKRD